MRYVCYVICNDMSNNIYCIYSVLHKYVIKFHFTWLKLLYVIMCYIIRYLLILGALIVAIAEAALTIFAFVSYFVLGSFGSPTYHRYNVTGLFCMSLFNTLFISCLVYGIKKEKPLFLIIHLVYQVYPYKDFSEIYFIIQVENRNFFQYSVQCICIVVEPSFT